VLRRDYDDYDDDYRPVRPDRGLVSEDHYYPDEGERDEHVASRRTTRRGGTQPRTSSGRTTQHRSRNE
jgi:hypothetical protein